MMIGTFAGCSGAVDAANASPFAVYRVNDDLKITIGDKREDIAKLIGPDEEFVVEFEDMIERVQYYDSTEISLDYDKEGVTRAIRFTDDKWKLFNGLTVGKLTKEVEALYPAEFIHKYPETEDLWIAHDEKGNPIKFTEQCPYVVRFVVEGGKVQRIAVQDNTSRGTIF